MRTAFHPDELATDDQERMAELAKTLTFVADFLARAEGPLLRSDFARFISGVCVYQLDELRADLRRFAGWISGEGFA